MSLRYLYTYVYVIKEVDNLCNQNYLIRIEQYLGIKILNTCLNYENKDVLKSWKLYNN